MASTESEITIQYYEQLGCADGILTRYFDDKMATLNTSQQPLASRAFDLLVSQHGAKMPYPLVKLAELLIEDKEALRETLDELHKAAILRRVQRQGQPWYELYHDIFAKRIEEWNKAYKSKQLQWQLVIRGGWGVFAVVAVFMVGYVAYDSWMNFHSRYLRLGKEKVSDQVEVYQGQLNSRDMFGQQQFLYETSFERDNIEADKLFETAQIAELEKTALMQIGQKPWTQRYASFTELGLFTLADKVFHDIWKAGDQSVVLGLATKLGATRSKKIIVHLQVLLKYDDANIRRAAIQALAGLDTHATIKPLLESLDVDDAEVREYAIRALSKFKDQEFIKRLHIWLTDDSANVRKAAIEAQENLKAVTMSMFFIQGLLKDNNADVRKASIKALANLKAQAPIEDLLKLLKDENAKVRITAIQTLANLKAQGIMQPLLDLLKDKDADVRSVAIQAFGNLNAQAAILPLLNLLKGQDVNGRSSAIQVLGNLHAQAAIDPLLELLNDPDSVVRSTAIQVLGNLNAQVAIDRLLELLNDPDSVVRSTAIKVLGNLNAQAAIDPLLELLNDPDSVVRSTAIKALGNLNAQAAIPSLLGLLNDQDAYVCSAAIITLSNLKAKDAIQPLMGLLKNDNDIFFYDDVVDGNAYKRNATIQALGNLNAQAAIEPLLAFLNDNDDYVRSAAVNTLVNLKAQSAIHPILALLEKDTSYMRRVAIRGVGKLNAQAATQALLALLKDRDTGVRADAIKELGKLKAQDSIQDLLELQKDHDGGVRKEAIDALKNMKVIMLLSSHKAQPQINDSTEQLKDVDLSTQQTAAISLSKLPQPPAELTEWQTEQITRLESALSALNDGTDEKRKIANDLGFVPVAKSVELLASLLQEQDVNVVTNAVTSLSNIAETKAAWIQPYVQQFLAFSENQDLDLQLAAIKALGQVYGGQPNPEIQQKLLKIATNTSSHEYLRLAAVDALGGTGRPEIAALLYGLLQDKNQTTLHFAIVYWLAKMPVLADKKEALLSVLQQRLAGLEQDKANWRKLRDANKTGQAENEKLPARYDPAQDNSGLTRWCDDYKIYQYAYAIAMQDPENAGITLLNHASYQARAAAIRALAEKASGELLQKLLAYYQDFDWQDLPSPRPYTTYRAIDKVLAQLENGSEHDLNILQCLKTKLDIPAKSENPTDQEQQQAALIERFDWTIDELKYRVQQKITTLQPTNAP